MMVKVGNRIKNELRIMCGNQKECNTCPLSEKMENGISGCAVWAEIWNGYGSTLNVEALKKLKDYCEEKEYCNGCIFYAGERCSLKSPHSGECPCDWKLDLENNLM